MNAISRFDLSALEVSAITAAAYLDACDSGMQVSVDPGYYKACGRLLATIFSVVNPVEAFPRLLDHSAAAREMVETNRINHRIVVSRSGYYAELATTLNRASTI
jgi:hypothetical protein